jgi:hypothetical protein
MVTFPSTSTPIHYSVFCQSELHSELLIAPLSNYKERNKQHKSREKRERERLSVSQDGLCFMVLKYSMIVYQSRKHSVYNKTKTKHKEDRQYTYKRNIQARSRN